MSNQGINLFGNYNRKVSFGASGEPAMQGGNEAIAQAQQATGTSYMSNRVNASKDANPLTTLGLTAGIGYGIGQAMDYFGPKCEGKYEESMLGKLGSWGDKFSKETKVGRFIERNLRKLNVGFWKASKKSRTAYALRNHSTSPSKGFPWDFARLPFHGLHGFLSMDTHTVLEEFTKPISDRPRKWFGIFPRSSANDFQKLEQYGMTQDAIETFEKSLSNKTFAQKAYELQLKELELLGATPAQITAKPSLPELQELAKELKITKKLGFKSVAEFNTVMADAVAHPKEIMAALERATANGNDLHISINRNTGTLGKIKSHFLGRKVSLSEYLNKYKATLGKGNKTYLGRALPKTLGWLTEGCTNRFAGGKMAPFIQAAIFADMAYHTVKAPKGEHGKTFVERFVNDFMYFVASTAGLIGLHKIGGWKYIGTNIDGREAYRAAQEAVNAKNSIKGFATKKLYKDAINAANTHLNVKGLKWYEKVMQKIGCFVNMGNEHFKPYLSPNKNNMNLLRRIANTNLIGVPLRLWLVMGVAMPFIVKAATKTVHMIFGKPTNSVLDEDKEEEQQQPELAMQNPQPQQNPNVPPLPPVDPNKLPNSNLIRQTVTGQIPPQQVQNPYNQYPQQNSQNNSQNNSNTVVEPVRTYIPSPVSTINQQPDTTAAEIALANADKAEQEVASILARRR